MSNMKYRVKLTIERSNCRSGLHKAGETFIVDEVCPPICHELWNNIYPVVYVLLNGGELDSGDSRALSFTASCPDGGRVTVHGEREEENGLLSFGKGGSK